MKESSEVTLPSGRKLKPGLAPFADGNNLFKSFSKSLQKISLEGDDASFLKDSALELLSDDALENCILKCAERSLINGERVDIEKSFEDPKHRQDFLVFKQEVGLANLNPFTKGLYSKYGHLIPFQVEALK